MNDGRRLLGGINHPTVTPENGPMRSLSVLQPYANEDREEQRGHQAGGS